jgi:uncharacterized protein
VGDVIRVGVISDTHGLMRPEVLESLQTRGVQHILHAGDVGSEEVLRALRGVAPTAAVRGNTDPAGAAWAASLPATRLVTIGDSTVYVLHEPQRMDLDPTAAGIDVVIFGHTHEPSVARQGTVLHINPGSAGPRRLSSPVTLAILTLGGPQPEAEIVYLL